MTREESETLRGGVLPGGYSAELGLGPASPGPWVSAPSTYKTASLHLSRKQKHLVLSKKELYGVMEMF